MSDSDLNLDDLIVQARSGNHRATRPGLILDLADALESTAARLREAEAVIYSIESEVQDFSQSDNDAMVAIERRLAAYRQTTNHENRAEEDEFAPGECDGSGTCSAPVHIHGCYRPHRSDECDSPDEYGHTDRENGSER